VEEGIRAAVNDMPERRAAGTPNLVESDPGVSWTIGSKSAVSLLDG
jgi:hypothetical protein